MRRGAFAVIGDFRLLALLLLPLLLLALLLLLPLLLLALLLLPLLLLALLLLPLLLLVLLLIVLKSPTLLTCWLLGKNRGIRRWRLITRHGIEPISAISAL